MIDYADPSLNPTRASKIWQLARTFSNLLAWSFGSLLFLPLVGGLLMLLFWQPQLSGAGAALSLIVLAAAGGSARRLRRKRSEIVLSYLLQAVQLQLPLSPMLKAAAAGESRAVANRLERLLIALEDGSPIGSALLLAAPHTSRRTVDLINAGEHNGCLAVVLKRLVDEPVLTPELLEVPAFFQAYGLIVFGIIAAVIFATDIFVIPKFLLIFHDFKLSPPELVRFVMGFGETIAPLLLLACVGMIMFTAGSAMRQLLSSAKPYRNPFKSFVDQIIWRTPFVGSVARDQGLADALGVIANGLDAGRPADQAIHGAAMPHLNAALQSQINIWAQAIERGIALQDAAASAGMPQVVVGLLASGARNGNLPAAMRFLARYYALRFSRVVVLIRGAAIPALALVAGSIVLLVALAIFEPMIAFAQAVSVPMHRW